MASQSTKTPDPQPDPAPGEPESPPATPAAAPGPLVMEYLGGEPKTYLFDGAPAQSAELGDVCEIPYDPGDGHWGPTKRKPNRLPDNHPDEAARRSQRQAAERARIHAALATPTEQAAVAAGEA